MKIPTMNVNTQSEKSSEIEKNGVIIYSSDDEDGESENHHKGPNDMEFIEELETLFHDAED